MFPAQGAGAPPQQAAPPPQQPSPWQPPQQQGFAPPQQQGFQRPPPGPPPGPAPNPYGQQPPNPYAQTAAANPYAPNPYGQQQPPPPHGQAPYSPHPAPHAATPAPMAGGAKKSNKGLLIGAVAAVAVAGGVVAFILLRGGGGASGGDSRDAVVKATLAGMAAGSVDDLLKLSDPEALYGKMVDCEGKTERKKSDMDRDDEDDEELSEKDKEERDPKKVREKQKKEFGDIVKLTKGAKIELVEIVSKEPPAPSDDEKKDDDDGDGDDSRSNGFVIKRGQRLMKGCVAKAPLRLVEVKLKVKVTPPKEEAVEQETEMMMIQVGKGWWLLGPPTISVGSAALIAEVTRMKDEVCACKDAACTKKLNEEFKASPRRKELKKQIKALPEKERDKIEKIDDEMDACERKLGAGEAITAYTQFKDKMCACQDRVCAEKVSQEMIVWSKSQMDNDTKPSTEDLDKMTEISKQLTDCMTKAYEDKSGGGIGATIGEVGGVAGGGGDLPASCIEYRAYMQKLATCDKLPQSSRDAFKQSLEQVEKAWKDLGNLPESARKPMDDACKQGMDAIKQSMSSMGC